MCTVKSTCTTRKCTAPPAITAAQLNPLVDMDLWAAIAAIGAFQGNNDDSWSNGKNYFWTGAVRGPAGQPAAA